MYCFQIVSTVPQEIVITIVNIVNIVYIVKYTRVA